MACRRLDGQAASRRHAATILRTMFRREPSTLAPQLPHLDEGRIRCFCWVPDAGGKPFAIAVGTDRQNSVYVCKLVDQGPCPILRHFRGHSDHVTSLGISRDLRYLASGSADGTICIWSLAEFARGKEPLGRWGAEFAVEGGKLIAKKSCPPGRSSTKACATATRSRKFAGRPRMTSKHPPKKSSIKRSPIPQKCWPPCATCPGERKWFSRPFATARTGPPSRFCPPGNRWPRCSSAPIANGPFGLPRATTTLRSTVTGSSAGRSTAAWSGCPTSIGRINFSKNSNGRT